MVRVESETTMVIQCATRHGRRQDSAMHKNNTVPHRYIDGGVALPATPDDSREPIHAQETKEEVSIEVMGSALLPQIFTEAGENATPAMSRD